VRITSVDTGDLRISPATQASQALGRPHQFDGWLSVTALVALACFLFALIAYNFVDIDLWHQLALIRESLRAGHLLRSDPFAYTPTLQPWIDHEWGAGAFAWFLTRWFGGYAIAVLKWLLAFGTGWLCLRTSKQLGVDARLFAVCAPLAIFLAHLGFFSAVRAQAYTFLFTALLIFCWQLSRAGTRAWLFLFPLWVNLHGGFVVGIGLTALYCAEEWLRGHDVRRWLAVLGVMFLETFLTPYGLSYFSYLRRALLMARPYAPEWESIWHLGPLWMGCFFIAIAVALYAIVATGIRNAPGLAPLAATAMEAALHRKLLPLFAITWVCYAPFYLEQTGVGPWLLGFMQRRRTFVFAAWAVLAFASAIAALRQKPWDLAVPQPLYPVGPVEYLGQQKFQGNVMVPFRLGAYVSWKLYPSVKVSLDNRYEEVYPNQVVRAVFDFYDARNDWRETLAAYPTDVVLVPVDSAISSKIAESGWHTVYRDRQFELYARPGVSLPQVDRSDRSFVGVLP